VLRAQTARLRRLTDDIAAVSRAEERQFDLHPVRTTPADLVHTALTAARPRYTASNVTLAAAFDGDVPDVDADPERIGQVLTNLLDNALRHTPPGGVVTVAVGPHPTGVRLSVTDTGEGISAEHLPHLFERLYRADTARDRDHGGSGIGLAIVHAIVHAHGGRVTATSDGPGTGATFALTLPAARPPHQARRRPRA
jgi:signal transduction histidine kinase